MTDTNLKLLPKGAFIITQDGQSTKGRFSMYALDRFCEEKKIPDYLTLLEKINIGMSLGDYADLIRIAFEDYFRDKPESSGWDKRKVMDMVDDVFDGVKDPGFKNLIEHAIGRVVDVKKINEAIKAQVDDEEQKKSSTKNLTDGASGSGPTSAE